VADSRQSDADRDFFDRYLADFLPDRIFVAPLETYLPEE
jgi:hypothetical protein